MSTCLPPYITQGKIAKACGMSRISVKRLLQRAAIAEKIGGRWVVGATRLRERLPEVYDLVFADTLLPIESDQN
jgi:DNA-binding transcriptional regulator LsrR (DeoR family)